MGDSPAVEERLHGRGAEDAGTVRGDLLGGSSAGKVPPEHLDEVGRVVLGQPEHREPVCVAVDDGEVGGLYLEEVHAEVTEGEIRLRSGPGVGVD